MRGMYFVTILTMVACGTEPEPELEPDPTAQVGSDLDGAWQGTCSSDVVEPMAFEWSLEEIDGRIVGWGLMWYPEVPENTMELDIVGSVDEAGAIALDFDLVFPADATIDEFDWPAVWEGTHDGEKLDGLLVLGPLDPYPDVFELSCTLTRVPTDS